MADITGNAFTIIAADDIPAAIEAVGTTASKQQVGKAVKITALGAELATTGDEADFIGIVKASSGEAEYTFAASKMVADGVIGANPTYAPYYEGNVNIPQGKSFTVERNCMTYVLTDGTVTFGDQIALDDDGTFKPAGSSDTPVGRAYSDADSNDVARVYIHAM